MKSVLLSLIVVLISSSLIFSQTATRRVVTADELVELKGRVLDSQDNSPVLASITFEKLPFGDNMGFTKVKDEGDYQLTLIRNNSYNITVKAEGYVTIQEVVKVDEDFLESVMQKDFFLTGTSVGKVLRLDINFAQSSSKIPEDAYPQLRNLIDLLNQYSNMVIQLEGHTDYQGLASANMRLSEQRVNAVKEYIVKSGINKNRIKTKAFGGTQPISRENTEEARKINRRVEARIIQN
jgi:OmpA-OmpF porin, OOP family